MICPRCLLRAPPISLRVRPSASTSSRAPSRKLMPCTLLRPFTFSSTTLKDQKPISADVAQNSIPHRSPPAATSTSAAQPFSSRGPPDIPSPLGDASPPTRPSAPARKKPKQLPTVTSSVAAGTVLRGLNYFKNKPDPVALEDSEYPPWLWTVLKDRTHGVGSAGTDPRLYSRSSNARRMARKRVRLEAKRNPRSEEKMPPLYAQSIDLSPAVPRKGMAGFKAAASARLKLRKAMTRKRKRDIGETNFLKAMR